MLTRAKAHQHRCADCSRSCKRSSPRRWIPPPRPAPTCSGSTPASREKVRVHSFLKPFPLDVVCVSDRSDDERRRAQEGGGRRQSGGGQEAQGAGGGRRGMFGAELAQLPFAHTALCSCISARSATRSSAARRWCGARRSAARTSTKCVMLGCRVPPQLRGFVRWQACFANWSGSKRRDEITCPLCRSLWIHDAAGIPQLSLDDLG